MFSFDLDLLVYNSTYVYKPWGELQAYAPFPVYATYREGFPGRKCVS